MKRLLKSFAALLLVGALSMCAVPFARAAQQSVTLVPPSGRVCPGSIPDNNLTTLTVVAGNCVFTATTTVTNPATGNAIVNPNLSDAALAMISELQAQGFLTLASNVVIRPATLFATVSGNTPLTLLAASMAGAQDVTVNLTATLAGAGTVTTDTAANIYAAVPNAVVGQTYKLRIVNSSSGAFAWTVAGGTGVTLTGTLTIAQNTFRDFYVTLTSATAVAMQSTGVGAGTL